MERIKEPLIHITRRDSMPLWKSLLIRFGAILVALVISAIFISASSTSSHGFFDYFASLFSGAFGTERRIWILLQNTALLLCVALALVVAFRMRFWNLGGNGQVLMGCLACAMCMYYLGGTLPDALVCLIMFVASVAAGAVWAVIPAVFKAFFNTNESLFTLMMNYIAMYLVAFFIALWYPNGTGAMPPLTDANLPTLGDGQMGRSLLTILIAVLVTALIFCYLRFSKHGYEIAVVGESQNTARYIGIDVGRVIVRTMAISGAVCGLAGLMLVAGTDHTISTNTVGGQGFTAIMVSWLAKFNPLVMVLASALLVFLSRGANEIASDFGLNQSFSDILTGIILFFIIGSEFFINYQIHFRKAGEKEA